MQAQREQVIVIDNGGGTCKVGFAGEAAPRKVFPNCSAKPKGQRQARDFNRGAPVLRWLSPATVAALGSAPTCGACLHPIPTRAHARPRAQVYMGDQLLEARDISQLSIRRPIDRGYLVDWGLQSELWARALRGALKASPSDGGLVMTEPPFNFPAIEAATEQARARRAQPLLSAAFASAPCAAFRMSPMRLHLHACHYLPNSTFHAPPWLRRAGRL